MLHLSGIVYVCPLPVERASAALSFLSNLHSHTGGQDFSFDLYLQPRTRIVSLSKFACDTTHPSDLEEWYAMSKRT